MRTSSLLQLIFLTTIFYGIVNPSLTVAAEARSFYEGKTINMIVSTSPGGATDVAGRLLSRYLGKYIPGHNNILAQNMAGRRRHCRR